MSPAHRDAEGRVTGGRTWANLVERLIQEGMERGDFDGVRGTGSRLPRQDDSAAGEWASAFRILRDAGAAPLWIEADKEARGLQEERDRLLARARRSSPLMHEHLRRDLRDLVRKHNAAVDRLNAHAPTPRQHRRRLVLGEALAKLEMAFDDGDDTHLRQTP